jgi:uroporphyrinogen decarboxylase
VFGTLRDVLGVEELLLGFYLMPDTIRDMIQTYTDLWLRLYAAIQDKVGIDHIHIWEDMSGRQGSLISMAMVEEFMMPAYDRIHAFAAEHDIPLVSVDSDGNVSELVPTMVRHGVNVFLPFEVQAGNDIEAYRREFPELGMIGGLDKNTLADGAAPRAMHRELDIAERMLARGRYIPGCDHLIPSNVSWARWREFVLALRRMTGAG